LITIDSFFFLDSTSIGAYLSVDRSGAATRRYRSYLEGRTASRTDCRTREPPRGLV